jgi:hypothetical protein
LGHSTGRCPRWGFCQCYLEAITYRCGDFIEDWSSGALEIKEIDIQNDKDRGFRFQCSGFSFHVSFS